MCGFCKDCMKETETKLYHSELILNTKNISKSEGLGSKVELCLECYDNIYVKKNKNLYKDNGDGSFTKFTNNSDSH